jgi:hypothetical protein
MRTRLASVLAFALVLVPMQAEAACAWVLWRGWNDLSPAPPYKHEHPVLPDGRIIRSSGVLPSEAFETKTECDQARRRGAKEKPWPENFWECWPDTIDPRGPKGGR